MIGKLAATELHNSIPLPPTTFYILRLVGIRNSWETHKSDLWVGWGDGLVSRVPVWPVWGLTLDPSNPHKKHDFITIYNLNAPQDDRRILWASQSGIPEVKQFFLKTRWTDSGCCLLTSHMCSGMWLCLNPHSCNTHKPQMSKLLVDEQINSQVIL